MRNRIDKWVKQTRLMARTGLLCVAIAAISACAGTYKGDQTLEQKLAVRDFEIQQTIDRIDDYRIHGWNYVDDRHVIFQGGPSDHYLLTFHQRCVNLRGANTIAFSTTLGRVTRFDEVLVKDHSGMPAERCIIQEIHELKKLS